MTTNGGVPAADPDPDDPIEPATPIPRGPRVQPKQDRTRLSLNLSKADYAALKQLSRWWGDAGISGTITRAVTIATRLYGAEHPDLRWADWLDIDSRPRPGWWELHVPHPTPDDPDHEDVSPDHADMTPAFTYPDAYYRYRYFDTTAQILYVGSTCHLARRRGEHSRHSHWWPQVDHSRTLIDIYPTAEKCAEAESECYYRDHPLYNLRPPAYYGTPGPRAGLGLDGTKLADELAWCALNEARRLSREGVPFPEWDIIDPADYDTDEYRAEFAANQAANWAHSERVKEAQFTTTWWSPELNRNGEPRYTADL